MKRIVTFSSVLLISACGATDHDTTASLFESIPPMATIAPLPTIAPRFGSDVGLFGLVKIGKGLREVKFGDTVSVSAADAVLMSNGVAAFDVVYSVRNYGRMATRSFRDTLTFGDELVSQQTDLQLGLGEVREIRTQAYLASTSSPQKLVFTVDADNSINDNLRTNNTGFILLQVIGSTAPTPIPGILPDLTTYPSIKIGKSEKSAKQGGVIELTKADALLISNGVPAFDIFYADKNLSSSAASGYKNTLTFNGNVVSQQTNRSIAANTVEDIATQAYLKPTTGLTKLVLKIDANNNIKESREDNNEFFVYIKFSGF